MITKAQYVKDLSEKEQVSTAFLVKSSSVAVGKNGKPYMNLVLMDKSGSVDGRIWDDVAKVAGFVIRDAFVFVEGKCQSYQGRQQIVIKEIRLLREDDVTLADYLVESDQDPKALYAKLLGYVSSMQDPYYKALAESVLVEDQEIVEKLMKAPAAKTVHHAYPSGLLEHIVSVTGLLDFYANHYKPILDRDLLFLGGFFHDLAKIWELSFEKVTDYTDEGKLIGHLVMGVELVTKKIAELEAKEGRLPGPFPKEKAILVKHVILSHHGELEYGSPKRPKCLEALVVHFADNLDSKINAIKIFTMEDKSPTKWTGLHRQFERYFIKPDWAGKDAAGSGI